MGKVMVSMKIVICFILGSMSFGLMGNEASASAPQRNLVISYVVYPQVELYVEFIKDIYAELGYSVKMIPTPSTRGLTLLNEGEVDADVVRLKQTTLHYPNTLLVEPALRTGSLLLLCSKEVVCDKSVLYDETTAVLAPEAANVYINKFHFTARLIKTEGVMNVINMLQAKRSRYGFFFADGQLDTSKTLSSVTIQDLAVFHVIHKKHRALLPLIQQKLIEKLPELQGKIDRPGVN
jgi:hypothetical protein